LKNYNHILKIKLIAYFIKIYNWLKDSIIDWTSTHSLPGFFKIPIYDVIVFLIKELKRDDINTRANSMAFSFFLALFPAIIFIFTLIPYIPYENFDEVLRNEIQQVMPDNAHSFLFEIIDDLRSIQRESLLSIGFVLAFFFSSNGMIAMMKGFEKSYDVSFKARNFFRKRVVAVWITTLLIVMLIISVALIIWSNKILDYVFDPTSSANLNYYAIQILRWTIIVALFYSVIAAIYRFGPPLKIKFGFFSPGATLATLSSILTSIIFSYFVDNFGRWDIIYGPLGALIVMLLWMQINCFIILAGFELNASIAVNRDIKKREK
jgi:membrane protein